MLHLHDKTCSETHLVLGKVQFVLNDVRRVRKKNGFLLRQIEDHGKWLMCCWACVFSKLELRWWNSVTLQWWTLPRLFFFEIPCPTLSPSTRPSWLSFAHGGSFLCGARDQRKPLFCYTHASHPCYGCNRMTVRYFEMPLATRKPRCSPSHWFGELKPDTNYNSVASCSSCHLVEDTLRVRKISMNDYHSLYNFTCLRLRHQFSRR